MKLVCILRKNLSVKFTFNSNLTGIKGTLPEGLYTFMIISR